MLTCRWLILPTETENKWWASKIQQTCLFKRSSKHRQWDWPIQEQISRQKIYKFKCELIEWIWSQLQINKNYSLYIIFTWMKAQWSVSLRTSFVWWIRLCRLVACCWQPSICCVRLSLLLFSSYSRSDKKNSRFVSTSLIRQSHCSLMIDLLSLTHCCNQNQCWLHILAKDFLQ